MMRWHHLVASTLSALVLVALVLAGCAVKYKKLRFNVNGEPGFHVFAVTIKKEGIVHTRYRPIRMQHAMSGPDGGVSLFVPSKGDRLTTEIYVSKPGFRFKDLTLGTLTDAENRRGLFRIRVERAASAVEEETALFNLNQARHLKSACDAKKWPAPCRTLKKHADERSRYFHKRYPKGTSPRRPSVVGRVPVVADWTKMRPLRFPLEVVTAGDHIVAREKYLKEWYVKRHGSAAKDLMFLRNHPHLRRNQNLVLLSGTGEVLFETELAGTTRGALRLAPMSSHEVAILQGNGDLWVFDTKTRKLRKSLRLQNAPTEPYRFAVSPSLDTIYVFSSPKDLHQYDGQGKLVHKESVKGLFAVESIAVTPKKACLVMGKLTWDRTIRDLRLGNLWATGSQTAVLRVARGPKGWLVSRITLFVKALWATPEGFWVYREKLVPHAFHALPSGERLARHTFRDYRNRLYLYSWEGKLLRSVDQTTVSCPRSGAAPRTSRKSLVTTRHLGHGRCGTIDRLLL